MKSDSTPKCVDIQIDDDDDDDDDDNDDNDDIAFNFHVNPLLNCHYLASKAFKHGPSQSRFVTVRAIKLCGGV